MTSTRDILEQPQVIAGVRVFDNVLPDPIAYRNVALRSEFRTVDFGHIQFHGISATEPMALLLPQWIAAQFPALRSTLTFFRRSPLNQVEPNFIHTDGDMGDWTGILYLNPDPPQGDGTDFWAHIPTGSIHGAQQTDWKDSSKWRQWHHVEAAFNRLVMFPSRYFHSRAIRSNYGANDGARLTQVVFGTGAL